MENEYIKLLCDSLEQALREPIRSPADFANLALAGERLRAVAPDWLGEGDAATREALRRYDLALGSAKSLAPTDLAERLDDALAHLQSVANGSRSEEETEEQELALTGVDEVLQVAVGAYRSNAVDPSNVVNLAEKARDGVLAAAMGLTELCERSVGWGADHAAPAEFPDLYAHRQALAAYSTGGVTLSCYVISVIASDNLRSVCPDCKQEDTFGDCLCTKI